MTAKTDVARLIVIAEFEYAKDTQNAIQYQQDKPADGTRPAIGSIYLTKAALAKVTGTKRIRVTVEAVG